MGKHREGKASETGLRSTFQFYFSVKLFTANICEMSFKIEHQMLISSLILNHKKKKKLLIICLFIRKFP